LRNRWSLVFVLLTALALVATACGDSTEVTVTSVVTETETVTSVVTSVVTETETVAAEPIRVGGSVSLAGFNAAVGEEFLRGLELWRDMINNGTGIYEGRETVGLLGRPVELVFSNDESSSEAALRTYERLITQEGVDFIFPPFGSGATGTIAPIAEREQKALIATTASAETIYEQGLSYIVMGVSPSSKYIGRAPEIMAEQGFATAAFLTLNNPFTLASSDFLRGEIEALDGGAVLSEDLFEFATNDFTAILTGVGAASPDVIVIQAFGTQAVTIYNQMADLGVDAPMIVMSAGAWRDDVFLAGAGVAKAECLIADHHWNPNDDIAGNAEFAAGYAEKYGSIATIGSDPSPAMGLTYGQLLTYAVDAIGESAIDDQSQIIDFLRNTDGLQTVLGLQTFDPETGKNTALTPSLIQFQGGERVIVWPPEVAQGDVMLPCAPLAGRPEVVTEG